MERFCVFGAGAIGSHLAARLAMAGKDVSVVARGDQLGAIINNGITLRADGKAVNMKVRASGNAVDLGRQDAVFVTVKAPAMPAAARSLAPLLSASTAVIFVVNGIPWWYLQSLKETHPGNIRLPKSVEMVAETIALERVIGSVILSPAQVIEPGVVVVQGAKSRLTIGEIRGLSTNRVSAIAEALQSGGLQTLVSQNIREAVWDKLITNLMTGPMSLLSRATYKDILRDPACRKAAVSIVQEVAAVARAFGCNPNDDAEVRLALVDKLPHKPSILQDLLLSRAMEVESLIDVPLALARVADVPVPTLELLGSLAIVSARSAGLYSHTEVK